MLKIAIPVLRVSSARAAESFYGKLGFRKRSAFRIDETKDDPCYMVVLRDDACLHLSSFPGDSVFGASVQIIVDDVHALFEEFQKADLPPAGEPLERTVIEQDWGQRELVVRDADGNKLVFAELTDG